MTQSPVITTRPSGALRTADADRRRADPCTMVILGALGDLSKRKLLPAIYELLKQGLVDDGFAVLGVGRSDSDTDDSFRKTMREALGESDEIGPVDDALWQRLCARLFFVSADLSKENDFTTIRQRLEQIEGDRDAALRNRLFYLALPPSVFEPIVKHLSESGLAPRTRPPETKPWVRVVIEKPFGRSLETAQRLNALVLSLFGEHQIFRIDHYLGKETVQNVLVLRFANSIFEPIWNRQWIQHVQITAAETVGVESRGAYYEEAGVVRDMFQNHLLQLLTLTAMEPPPHMTADAVRDEKVKVLQSVRLLTPETIPHEAVRAQYTGGVTGGRSVPGYTEEPGVARDSMTPTYAGLRLFVDNWRWNGVPFYLRSGKRMTKRMSEIVVQFRTPPHLMFGDRADTAMRPNTLVMRVQPNEGVSLNFEVKVPGAAVALTSAIDIAPVSMDFAYHEAFGEVASPAYETLLLDIMIGEATLFTRSDEVEAAWRVVDPLISYWEEHRPRRMPTYAAGSWGPREAEAASIMTTRNGANHSIERARTSERRGLDGPERRTMSISSSRNRAGRQRYPEPVIILMMLMIASGCTPPPQPFIDTGPAVTGAPFSSLPPLQLLPPGLLGRVDIEHYDVYGRSPNDVRVDMRRAARDAIANHNDSVAVGDTHSSSSWRWDTQPDPAGDCSLLHVDVTVTVTIHLPRWSIPLGAAPEAIAEWNRFVGALELHEGGHKEITIESLRSGLRRLAALHAPCATIESQAKQITAAVAGIDQAAQARYDALTRHGLAQGTGFITAPNADGDPRSGRPPLPLPCRLIAQDTTGLRRIRGEDFALLLPPSYHEDVGLGASTDSTVWSSGPSVVTAGYRVLASPATRLALSSTIRCGAVLGGHAAEVVTGRGHDGSYVVAVYWADIGQPSGGTGPVSLYLVGRASAPTGEAQMLASLWSIRFGK